jgi:hypothetical protein
MGLLGAIPLTRRRFPATSYVDGRPVAGAATDTAFEGSVQPLPERDRQVLPEGVRHRDARKVYVETPGFLRTADQHLGVPADQVLVDDAPFTVVHTDDSHPIIAHQRCYLVRVQEGA